ncbi:MAG: hypothetical protein KIC61_07395 [Staphylococcus sp.]|nr:hypothetical protein [Staphylococcus sp.]
MIKTKRKYGEKDVYEVLQERLNYLFTEFDNIYVSFSGGKDSGLLLNLTLDFQKKYYPNKKIGVFHQDFEAQYSVTTEYIERTFNKIENEVEPYWVCLPMATRTALSSYEMFWYPWDDTKRMHGFGQCLNIHMLLIWKIILCQLITIVCIKRTLLNNSVGGIE